MPTPHASPDAMDESPRASLVEAYEPEETSGIDAEQTSGVDEELYYFPIMRREAPFATLDELCAAAGQQDCSDEWSQHWVPRTPNPALRELTIYEMMAPPDFAGNPRFGYLVVRGDDGWRVVDRVTLNDTTDSYGVVETYEHIDAPLQFNGRELVLVVDGQGDESEDEAAVYFACEEQHPGDQEAVHGCVRRANIAPARAWTRTHRYEIVNGRLRLISRTTVPRMP